MPLVFRIALPLAFLALIATCPASAGVVVSVAGSGNSFDNNEYIGYDSGPIRQDRSATTSDGQSAKGTVSSAYAHGNLILDDVLHPGLRLRTSAKASGGDVAGANAWAVAQWGDTIRLSPESAHAEHLAVVFSVHGEYGYTRLGRHQLEMTVGVANISNTDLEGSDPQAFRWAYGISFFPRAIDSIDPLISGTSMLSLRRGAYWSDGDLDAILALPEDASNLIVTEPSLAQPGSSVFEEIITGAFGWQQTFYVPYVEEIGGYNLNIFAFAGSSAVWEGSTGIDALNTITLDAVTYADGSEIVGPIEFDSGFRLSAVPEPSSPMILAISFLSFLKFHRRRRTVL
ncbi:MAG: hypothetical protein R3C09_24395 [Pirellulaceae bacterium]